MTLVCAGSLGWRVLWRGVRASHHHHLHGSVVSLRKLHHTPPPPPLPHTSSLLRVTPVLRPTTTTTRCYSLELDDVRYDQISDETLESLCEYLEELVESDAAPHDCDILYNTGVLTLHLGSLGTYVINKQSPNKQIWLSSPVSGPKRFDFLAGAWVYRHSGETLHGVLSAELSKVLSVEVDLVGCAFGSTDSP